MYEISAKTVLEGTIHVRSNFSRAQLRGNIGLKPLMKSDCWAGAKTAAGFRTIRTKSV